MKRFPRCESVGGFVRNLNNNTQVEHYELLIDDIELLSSKAEAPDIHGLVGIFVRQPLLKTLEVIREESISEQLRSRNLQTKHKGFIYPMKYSMGSDNIVRQCYREGGLDLEFQAMKESEWKRKMLHKAFALCEDVTVFIAVVTSALRTN
jgi:hypothetical protein